MEDITVSIVIICMNNMKNIYPCLESIRKHTRVSYEVLVVAYLFTEENLKKVKSDFPWVTFVVSDEIRGFSENNNLALRCAKGKYCFVVNDDTEMKMPVIDELVKTIELLPDNVAIVSPVTTHPDGRIQFCGRPYVNWKHIILQSFHLWKEMKGGKAVNQKGVFKSYNIVGAAFLIKRDIFKNIGWFDERYFFCPEDIALSTTLNKKGFACYVNSDVHIIHYGGMSGKSSSIVQTATYPAAMRGKLIFFGHRWYSLLALRLTNAFLYPLKYVYHKCRSIVKKSPNGDEICAIGDLHCIRHIFSSKTPKEIFSRYFIELKTECSVSKLSKSKTTPKRNEPDTVSDS